MSGPCHSVIVNGTTMPHIYGTPCECGDQWTSMVDFQNHHSICYSLPLLYTVWGASLIIALTNFIRLGYCLFWFIYQRRHHGWMILSVGAFQVLTGFFTAAACLAASSVIKLLDMQHTLLGYHKGLTVVFMFAISISFLSFVRSHWSYIHITLATGLVAAAHRQGAVRTVRTVLILDVIMFGSFVFVSTPIALASGGDDYTVARALLISSMGAFWFHALISVPLFFFYGALITTINQGMVMKSGGDPAMIDLRDRLQSLRRRQFSTIAGAVVFTVGVHVTEATLLATWAYSWPASHLLIGVGLTGYSFKYWSPSQENLGIARQLALPLPGLETSARGDAYLLNSPASGGTAPQVPNGFLNNKKSPRPSFVSSPHSPPQKHSVRATAGVATSKAGTRSPPPPVHHPPAGYSHPFHAGGTRVATISLPLSPHAARHATGFAAIEMINATNRTDREHHQQRALAVTSPSSEQRSHRALALPATSAVATGVALQPTASTAGANGTVSPQHQQLFTRTGTTRNLGISPISGPATGPATSHSPVPFHMPPTTMDDDDDRMTARSVRTIDGGSGGIGNGELTRGGTLMDMTLPTNSANSSAPDLLRVVTAGPTMMTLPSLPLPERSPSVASIVSPTAVAWQ